MKPITVVIAAVLFGWCVESAATVTADVTATVPSSADHLVSDPKPLLLFSTQYTDARVGLPAYPETVVYDNGLIVYEWTSIERTRHDGYTVPHCGPYSEVTPFYKMVQLPLGEFKEFIDTLQLSKLNGIKTAQFKEERPEYMLTFWNNGQPSTYYAAGNLYGTHLGNGQQFDSYGMRGRHKVAAPLLKVMDSLQYFDDPRAVRCPLLNCMITLYPRKSGRAPAWPKDLPEIDLPPDFNAHDPEKWQFQAPIDEDTYLLLDKKLAEDPNDTYRIDGHVCVVHALGSYQFPHWDLLKPILHEE